MNQNSNKMALLKPNPLLSFNYATSQFEQLSNRSRNVRLPMVSPREEIYNSIIKDIHSITDLAKSPPRPAQINSLVKKASGILRLSSYKNYQGSSDPIHGSVSVGDTSRLSNNDATRTQSVVASQELDKLQRSREAYFNKYAPSGSKIKINNNNNPEDCDVITFMENSVASRSSETTYLPNSSRTQSLASSRSDKSSISGSTLSSSRTIEDDSETPESRHFDNHGQAISESYSKQIVDLSDASSTISALSLQMSDLISSRQSSIWESKSLVPVSQEASNEFIGFRKDYIKHVFVIKGQVLTHKGIGFESFCNWFGDMSLVRNRKHNRVKFHKELDMNGFQSSEIKLKLYDGYKLMIQAYRPARDGLPPMRFKTRIILPNGILVENLIICRNALGRLIIQDKLPIPPVQQISKTH